MKNSQLVFVPSPGISHLVATVEFAKLLINHDPHVSIVVFIIKARSQTAVDSYTESLASAPNFPKRLRLIHLPNSEPHPGSDLHNLVENQKPQVREAVSRLIEESNSSPDSPRLAGFVVDMFCTGMIDVANEFGVPGMVFYTSGLAFLGLMLHLHELKEQGIVDTFAFNFKDSGTELAIPSFANPVPANALPTILLEKKWESFVFNYVNGIKKAKGIIVNTFEELEPDAVHSFSNITDIPIYPVGPILSANADVNDRVQQVSDIIKWLDDQPPSSVIFLCFGSWGSFDEDQVKEIASALENSGVRFLWALRKPPPKGSGEAPSDYSNPEEALPKGFSDRTAEVGRVIGWAPQAQILAHKATGGFISHCGWNSTIESIYFGVPIAAWPLYAEQQVNAFQLVRELKMAAEIALDYWADGGNTIVSAERIERGIKEVMEEGSEIRKKVKHMSEISKKTLEEGGSSYSSLNRLTNDFMHMI